MLMCQDARALEFRANYNKEPCGSVASKRSPEISREENHLSAHQAASVESMLQSWDRRLHLRMVHGIWCTQGHNAVWVHGAMQLG